MYNGNHEEDDWRGRLTDAQYKILREKGTEAPFSGKLLTENRDGMYVCSGCGQALFRSDSKYESTVPGLAGWPSFAESANTDAIKLIPDDSYGMQRTEVICTKCGGHLGHIFPDAGSPSGEHYCINSLALNFMPEKKQ